MSKYNYFQALTFLSEVAAKAIEIGCSDCPHPKSDTPSALRRSCDRTVCELEDALFSDFLPPMERETLAACAHCLSRVVNEATELIPLSARQRQSNQEGKVCIRLGTLLKDTVSMLETIRKPKTLPDTKDFRALLTEARLSHEQMLCDLRAGALPRSMATVIIQTGRLRTTLSEAFDCVVEVMLENI